MGGLTEECFQQGHLGFFGDKQWIHYNREDGSRTVIEVDALRTKEGTFPEGSQWTRNPIPACRFPTEAVPEGKLAVDPSLSVYGTRQDIEDWWEYASYPCPYGAQFAPPDLSLEGRGGRGGTGHPAIVDKVVIPKGLTPGDYVLSFRLVGWDKIINTCILI